MAATVVACSDTEISSSAPDGGQVEVGDLPRPSLEVPATSLPASLTTASDPAATDEPADATVTTDGAGAVEAPVPTDGVPGIDGGTLLCSSWSRLVGTRQVLSLAANFGDLDDLALARLEVIAAPLVQQSAAALDAALAVASVGDAGLDAERVVVVEQLFGRVGRRADAAVAALADTEPPTGTADLLAQVWLDGLRLIGPDDVVPPLADLGPDIGPLVAQASGVFADDAPRWDEDAELDVSEVEVPLTESLIERECPDLSALGVGDAV